MSRKITTEEFIERAKKVHGDRYDYSLVEYKGRDEYVKIICPIHGVFEQTPHNHLSGYKCNKCFGTLNRTTDDFIRQAKKVHGDKYDYSLVEYKGCDKEIEIICPIHGIFKQTPTQHLRTKGCQKCSGSYIPSTEEFIENANKIHNYKYDYSLTEYKGSHEYIKIICPIHGVFEQYATDHIKGCGCKKCKFERLSKIFTKSKEQFISDSKKIHGEKYNYSIVDYINAKTEVDIICPIHGVFKQTPNKHLIGHGCPRCNDYSTEKDIEHILQKERIIGIREKTFDWLIYKDKMKLDFYIPKYNIAIECQGIQHFEPKEVFGGIEEYNKTIDRDKKKRELCEQHGIKVFYYANYQYDFPYKVYTDPEELIAEIKKIDPVNNS